MINPRSWKAQSLRRAVKAAGVALWSWNVETDEFAMDDRGYELWAVQPGEAATFEVLSSRIHPADQDRVRAAFAATRAIEGTYEIDFRVVVDGDNNWISARGIGDDVNLHQGVAYGVFLDVTGRKQAEESSELLAGEMSHRVKNLMAIATGLTQISSRSTTTAKEMALELTGRLTALGRAHDLVRPLPGNQGTAALLGDLMSILLSPYEDLGAFGGRIRVAVPRMGVGEASATTLALVIHELATNSLKYGALSSETGTLDLSGFSEKERIKIVWTERGGPEVVPPKAGGWYGNRLVERSISSQLGGSIEYDWSPEGLIATLWIEEARLAA